MGEKFKLAPVFSRKLILLLQINEHGDPPFFICHLDILSILSYLYIYVIIPGVRWIWNETLLVSCLSSLFFNIFFNLLNFYPVTCFLVIPLLVTRYCVTLSSNTPIPLFNTLLETGRDSGLSLSHHRKGIYHDTSVLFALKELGHRAWSSDKKSNLNMLQVDSIG